MCILIYIQCKYHTYVYIKDSNDGTTTTMQYIQYVLYSLYGKASNDGTTTVYICIYLLHCTNASNDGTTTQYTILIWMLLLFKIAQYCGIQTSAVVPVGLVYNSTIYDVNV